MARVCLAVDAVPHFYPGRSARTRNAPPHGHGSWRGTTFTHLPDDIAISFIFPHAGKIRDSSGIYEKKYLRRLLTGGLNNDLP